ncbi:hypothetical protein RYX36_015693 [Vicia faba]
MVDQIESCSPNTLVQCRICHDEDEDLNMDTPCSCSGTLQYAHRICVQRWCNEKGDTTCEICQQQFKGYTAPQSPLFHYRGNWEIPRVGFNNHQFIALFPANHEFLDFNFEYSAPSTRSRVFIRIVAIIVLSSDISEPKKKLKNIVMAATRDQRFERVAKSLKVASVFNTLVEEMKAMGIAVNDDSQCTHSDRSPVLLLMGGGMGAGKSTVLKDILKEPFWAGASGNAVVIEADAFKESDVIYRALRSIGHHDMIRTAELDGCFSSDSDIFLFGARTVYREICLGDGGYVVCYEMAEIENKLGLGRDSLIALSLLLGSDYHQGVHGLGPELACQIVKSIGEKDVLKKFASEGLGWVKKRKGIYTLVISILHFSSILQLFLIIFSIFFVYAGAKNNIGKDDTILQVIDAYLKPKCHSADSDSVLKWIYPSMYSRKGFTTICQFAINFV